MNYLGIDYIEVEGEHNDCNGCAFEDHTLLCLKSVDSQLDCNDGTILIPSLVNN